MIVHGRAMRVPNYTHEQAMETTMLRRSIKDNKTIVDNVSNKLGYEYASCWKSNTNDNGTFKSGG